MTKKVVRTWLFLLLVLFLMIRQFAEQTEEAELAEVTETLLCDEQVFTDSLTLGRTHQRTWAEYMYNEEFCTQYQVAFEHVAQAASYRTASRVRNWRSDADYWHEVYRMLYHYDKGNMVALQDSLLAVGQARQLDRGAFARMVVAFVQDIPYNYIMPKGCEGYDQHPCVPNERYGILSPVEFLYRLQGDCDTRTVLLFTLLTNLGYQPVIVNSSEYAHSMLALDIPASGDYLVHKGRRYAFWETTNTGWLPGMIPPGMNNLHYWHVVLDTDQL